MQTFHHLFLSVGLWWPLCSYNTTSVWGLLKMTYQNPESFSRRTVVSRSRSLSFLLLHLRGFILAWLMTQFPYLSFSDSQFHLISKFTIYQLPHTGWVFFVFSVIHKTSFTWFPRLYYFIDQQSLVSCL